MTAKLGGFGSWRLVLESLGLPRLLIIAIASAGRTGSVAGEAVLSGACGEFVEDVTQALGSDLGAAGASRHPGNGPGGPA